jgi:hypothetical protein
MAKSVRAPPFSSSSPISYYQLPGAHSSRGFALSSELGAVLEPHRGSTFFSLPATPSPSEETVRPAPWAWGALALGVRRVVALWLVVVPRQMWTCSAIIREEKALRRAWRVMSCLLRVRGLYIWRCEASPQRLHYYVAVYWRASAVLS